MEASWPAWWLKDGSRIYRIGEAQSARVEWCWMIEVKRTREGEPLEFEIIVRVGGSETRHHVTMARDTCERLTAGRHTPERCIEAAFQFLLDREPKESILRHFDVTVISHYFPEFERELPSYLSQP